MKPRVLLGLPLLAFSAVLCAQDYLPPESVIEQAIGEKAEVLAAQARADAARAQAQALRAGTHEFEASISPQQRRTQSEGRFDEWEVQLSRGIRLPGKARLDREIGARTEAAAVLRSQDAQHDAARELLGTWMEWLRAAAASDEAQTRAQSLLAESEALQQRVRLGDAAQLELDMMGAELAAARVQAVEAQARQMMARQSLQRTFPQVPVPVKVPDLPEPQPLARDPAHWHSRLVATNYELRTIREEVARQQATAERARADRLPDPSVGVRMMEERSGEERSVGLVFSMPLPGRYRSAVAAAERADARALEREADAMLREAEHRAELLLSHATNTLAQWQAQQQAYAASTQAAQRLRRGWELGELGLAERLLAERQEREAALRERTSRVEALEAALMVRIDSHDLWHGDEPGGH